MEQAYKTALEIILNMCKKENYINTEYITLVCETALKDSTVEDGGVDVCS